MLNYTILVYKTDGKFVGQFRSVTYAGAQAGADPSAVSKIVNGVERVNQIRGYTFIKVNKIQIEDTEIKKIGKKVELFFNVKSKLIAEFIK